MRRSLPKITPRPVNTAGSGLPTTGGPPPCRTPPQAHCRTAAPSPSPPPGRPLDDDLQDGARWYRPRPTTHVAVTRSDRQGRHDSGRASRARSRVRVVEGLLRQTGGLLIRCGTRATRRRVTRTDAGFSDACSFGDAVSEAVRPAVRHQSRTIPDLFASPVSVVNPLTCGYRSFSVIRPSPDQGFGDVRRSSVQISPKKTDLFDFAVRGYAAASPVRDHGKA